MALILFDLDGVIRTWHALPTLAIEHESGLPAGTIEQVAFSRPLLIPAITGMISDGVWREKITESLKEKYPNAHALDAIRRWSASVGEVDQTVFSLVQRCRTRSQVALLTNATSRLRQDLDALGISQAFDYVFNSAEWGDYKPNATFFSAVLQHAGIMPHHALLIDDSPTNVASATGMGIPSHVYRDSRNLGRFLEARAVLE